MKLFSIVEEQEEGDLVIPNTARNHKKRSSLQFNSTDIMIE